MLANRCLITYIEVIKTLMWTQCVKKRESRR